MSSTGTNDPMGADFMNTSATFWPAFGCIGIDFFKQTFHFAAFIIEFSKITSLNFQT